MGPGEPRPAPCLWAPFRLTFLSALEDQQPLQISLAMHPQAPAGHTTRPQAPAGHAPHLAHGLPADEVQQAFRGIDKDPALPQVDFWTHSLCERYHTPPVQRSGRPSSQARTRSYTQADTTRALVSTAVSLKDRGPAGLRITQPPRHIHKVATQLA